MDGSGQGVGSELSGLAPGAAQDSGYLWLGTHTFLAVTTGDAAKATTSHGSWSKAAEDQGARALQEYPAQRNTGGRASRPMSPSLWHLTQNL